MKPSRVAYVVGVFPKLSETFVANELAEVRRRGIKIKVLSLRRPTENQRHEIVERAGLLDCTVYDTEKFSEVLDEFRPELVHAHFATQATAVARESAANLGVPFTFTAHRYDIYDKPPADFAARAAAAGVIVTVSQANVRHLTETFGVPPESVRVIPCGVDVELFQPRALEEPPNWPKATDTPMIVCVARQVRFKNLGLLLEACAELRERGVVFRCVLVGDGPLHAELKAKRAELGLDSTVEMLGAAEQGEVVKWWQRADIAALPSNSEGMPVCLMEAASCGVPAVATAVGGVPELVGEGETGFLVPPGDAQAFATALERLFRDPELRTRMGCAARRRAEERFSLARQVDRLLAVWYEILDGGARP